MLEVTIKNLLELYPRGVSNNQLLWRLRKSGLRIDAQELLFDLKDLSQRGEIVRDHYGRWSLLHAAKSHTPEVDGVRNNGVAHGSSNTQSDILSAVHFSFGYENAEVEAATEIIEDQLIQEITGALPEPAKLLSYYAATLRHDPRGRVAEFIDRHGAGWQTLYTQGNWWSGAKLSSPMVSLPEVFREALSRRRADHASIGWPLTNFSTQEGTTIFPAFLLPARIELVDDILFLHVDGGKPSVNPNWLKQITRQTAWTENALVEFLFPDGEDGDLSSVSIRMRHALATLGGDRLKPADLANRLHLNIRGLSNCAALFLPDDTSFTRGAANDLETIANWPEDAFRSTALHSLFTENPREEKQFDFPVLASENSLTDRQMDAVESALSNPLTVIQGPPGTGKSHVVLNILLSAFLSGRSVLFASKNHQALDEVEDRIEEIAQDLPFLTRGRDSEGERDTDFLKELKKIAETEIKASYDPNIRYELDELIEEAKTRGLVRANRRAATDLNLSLCDLVEQRASQATSNVHLTQIHANIWIKLFRAVLNLLYAKGAYLATDSKANIPASQINAKIKSIYNQLERLSADLDDMPQTSSSRLEDPTVLEELALRWAKQVLFPSEDERLKFADYVKDLEFERDTRANRMELEDAQRVLAYRPLWAVSTLSVPARTPLIPGLFDYVIFDEASQCDIASALPLLARAKQAVIVGDPMQLNFIPTVGKSLENALMDSVGIPKRGRGRLSQGTVSLFRFCDDRPTAKRFFLKDQFRSSPGIIDYLNSEFYTKRGLEGRREQGDFETPKNYKPGICWENVEGHVSRPNGGNVNLAEAKHIGARLRELADDKDFKGSVGVLSPFNAQVAQIQKVVASQLSDEEQKRLNLRIASIDKFQGGEANVIFFSLVLSHNAPQSARTFIQKERRRLNVAISRARAVCVVVGDLNYARRCNIKHIKNLADHATRERQKSRAPYDSIWERRLAEGMRRRNISFIPQYPVGTRYLDFALDPDGRKIDVEVDGKRWHTDADGNRKVSDRLRDNELRTRGWIVRRFWVHELSNNMEHCLDLIEQELSRG